MPAKPQPLNARTLKHWTDRVAAPAYDRSLVTPGVVHFGVGGFHRAHQAMYHDRLMNQGTALDWGICGVGVLEQDLHTGLRDGAVTDFHRDNSAVRLVGFGCGADVGDGTDASGREERERERREDGCLHVRSLTHQTCQAARVAIARA